MGHVGFFFLRIRESIKSYECKLFYKLLARPPPPSHQRPAERRHVDLLLVEVALLLRGLRGAELPPADDDAGAAGDGGGGRGRAGHDAP